MDLRSYITTLTKLDTFIMLNPLINTQYTKSIITYKINITTKPTTCCNHKVQLNLFNHGHILTQVY